ncbi:MAG TPA: hypothetical protein VN934_10495 [Candidatus Tumulicola sp.]|nr:hypothetical protein [Candidatus Tumulicola sp.]
MRSSSIVWKQVAIGAVLVGIAVAASGFGSCSGYSPPGPIFGAVVATPNPLTVNCQATFSVSQVGYGGPFGATSNNANVTVAATSPPNTFLVMEPSGTFTGAATITVTGYAGGQTTENLNVTSPCLCVRHHDMWGTRKHAR